jgi:hypothetical protein
MPISILRIPLSSSSISDHSNNIWFVVTNGFIPRLLTSNIPTVGGVLSYIHNQRLRNLFTDNHIIPVFKLHLANIYIYYYF